jgi:FO synthase subunit 1
MLEQSSSRLLRPGAVHAAAPSKRPELRRNQLIQAGEMKIPFTTGILAGIGETEAEQLQTLEEIAQLSNTYGHIGEVPTPLTNHSETNSSNC